MYVIVKHTFLANGISILRFKNKNINNTNLIFEFEDSIFVIYCL